MWYVSLVLLFRYSHSNFFFQQINVGSRCSGLGNYIFFNSRAPASFQSLSEVSALVFIFSKEIVCEQAHLWVPRVSGKVRVIERGVWCWSASKVSLDLWSLSFPGPLSLLAPKSERENLRTRLNVLPPTRVLLKREPVYRLGKRIPCFIQISFWGIIFSTLTTLLMSFALNHQF